MIPNRLIKVLLVLVTFTFSLNARSDVVTVAVASNFTFPMKEIATAFEGESLHKVRLAFGSSGKLYAQIKHGAPYQLFLSADQLKPLVLEKEGLALPNSRFTYAEGRLALWSKKPNLVNQSSTYLKSNQFNKVAMANPKLAPYGVAARNVLDHLSSNEGLDNQAVLGKTVMGENIAQTYQFVSTGNADIGFVSLSQIMSKGQLKQGSAWIIPKHFYQPIKQDAVLLRKAENNQAAKALYEYMRTQPALDIIKSYGYDTEAGS